MGVDSRRTTPAERRQRVEVLRATVTKYLPEFTKLIAAAVADPADAVLLHQDAFAAGYDDDEYTLLGMAVKYAGLHGVNLQVIAKQAERT